jgi:hypothetical protein
MPEVKSGPTITATYQFVHHSNLRRSTASSDAVAVTAVIVLVVVLAALAASLFLGRDSRVLDDERGWWPAYRRDRRDP